MSNSTTESRSNFGGFVILVGIFTILIFAMKVVWVPDQDVRTHHPLGFQKFQARLAARRTG